MPAQAHISGQPMTQPIAEFDLKSALAKARKTPLVDNESMLDVLVKASGQSVRSLAETLEDQSGVYVVSSAEGTSVVADHPQLQALLELQAVPLSLREHPGLRGVMALKDPWSAEAIGTVEKLLNRAITPVAVGGKLLAQWIDEHLADKVVVVEAPKELTPADIAAAFVEDAIKRALDESADELHFEPTNQGLRAQLRRQGSLVPLSSIEGAEMVELGLARIKVLAQLDSALRALQDGWISYPHKGNTHVLRLSIMPGKLGEDISLHRLAKPKLGAEPALALDTLELGPATAHVRESAALPSGLVLVAGTGDSGKSSTAYAMLQEAAARGEKVATVEIHIEQALPGVLQLALNERKGLTATKLGEALTDHGVDRMLVADMRGAEQASVAVAAALEGRAVIGTMAAAGVPEVIARFKQFGLSPADVSAALRAVVVQRLVRVGCPHCGKQQAAGALEAAWLTQRGQAPQKVLHAPGCPKCNHTGYIGRRCTVEVVAVDDELRDMVARGAALTKVQEHLAKLTTSPIRSQILQLVASHKTTVAEARRLLGA